jgi:hypothetical protein
MWAVRQETLEFGRVIRSTILSESAVVSYSDFLQHLTAARSFREFFNSTLTAAPFDAFRWETPAVTAATIDRPFEFVMLDSPGLARTPDRNAFAAQFATSNDDALAFPNLGGDATLIVPCPRGLDSQYAHLAAFVRQAPAAQRDALWKLVGETMRSRVGQPPVWLSTAGAGVSWLHVRLDDRPKYYGYAPYRSTQ